VQQRFAADQSRRINMMTSKVRSWLIAGAIGTALAVASPALAFHGGMHMGGGMGGMHMGGGMGGMHFGGSHFAGPGGHFGAMNFARPGFSAVGRPGFAPRFSRFAFHDRFFFRHHRFNRFAFGAPFVFATSFDSCWRRVWTGFGPRWINVCGGFYGY
jgi:hypothetical protein